MKKLVIVLSLGAAFYFWQDAKDARSSTPEAVAARNAEETERVLDKLNKMFNITNLLTDAKNNSYSFFKTNFIRISKHLFNFRKSNLHFRDLFTHGFNNTGKFDPPGQYDEFVRTFFARHLPLPSQ